ncbi:MAG TPA: ABC transporter ATP-binding protein [Ferrovibrio sp.]|jgi:branched-chain amino acid transport system ATP-binding protein|uniref:ABC transporter ATP-binding protein n=1 Tax=Ferrovibrio sp. TaxID=1917215 RepID=UPI002B4B1A43|nr:ABC transporter ATP-binding protein [Ferrovibrio sp.]HLT76610.1 ABC transporter ATP-binding protein [Ferrovibrio sp.]
MSAPLLSVSGISKSFRGLRAVRQASLEVPQGGIVSLIGPNGAGKTTVFNMIAGVFRPDEGSITFDGKRIDGLRPDQICHAGIGRTFQIVKPFKELTALENVLVGALRAERDVRAAKRKAEAVLDRLGMLDKRGQPAAQLTLPERKRLEVARALAGEPKLLLLDEVMAGLRPTETDQMVAVFREINAKTGMTILLIEHVMRAVMALSQQVVVLHHGQVIADGTPEQVVRDPAVLECYLGEEAAV